jgi:hypothetical protein
MTIAINAIIIDVLLLRFRSLWVDEEAGWSIIGIENVGQKYSLSACNSMAKTVR